MAMSENSAKVLTYLKNVKGQDVTASDVAEALEMDVRVINGIFTSAIQRKGLGIRVPAEQELDDGSHKAIKLLELTDEGYAFDPYAEADE